ncbi:MAG TPA: CapA family protein, partial [Euzebya sp.]|nr:CapA family protein [Euzebya sp.]
MLDWPSRVLLALTSAVLAFALTGMVVGGPDQSPATLLGARPKIPDFARQPALPGEESEEAQPPTPPVTIAFAGDVHGEPPIAGLLDADEDPFEGVAALLQAADLTVVNLETAVGTTGVPADKTFTFQADARQCLNTVALTTGAEVDVVSLLLRVVPEQTWPTASAYPRHLDVALQAVRDAAAQADHVVVTIHWGQER